MRRCDPKQQRMSGCSKIALRYQSLTYGGSGLATTYMCAQSSGKLSLYTNDGPSSQRMETPHGICDFSQLYGIPYNDYFDNPSLLPTFVENDPTVN
jgi:hypothetical protein